jgi:ABC-type transporter Mla maintaining outer membrane lipid asymmetry ATPase subunit MlaF
MKIAIHFHKVLKMVHGKAVLRIQDLKIYERQSVVFFGLTHEVEEMITNQITCAYAPEQGNVLIYGRDSREIAEKSWFKILGDFGIYDNSSPFLENASVGENLAAMFRGKEPTIKEPKLSTAVLRLANLVQLTITDLSKIMNEAVVSLRMKVRLARALALSPRVLILRNPTADLNPADARKLIQLMRTARRKLKFTIVLFTSDRWVVPDIADRVIFLNSETGVIVENQLRRWYHYVLPFLKPSRARLVQLSRNILKYKSGSNSKV